MRISDWSSDVCSSDLAVPDAQTRIAAAHRPAIRDMASKFDLKTFRGSTDPGVVDIPRLPRITRTKHACGLGQTLLPRAKQGGAHVEFLVEPFALDTTLQAGPLGWVEAAVSDVHFGLRIEAVG